jgi:hypothetical protein
MAIASAETGDKLATPVTLTVRSRLPRHGQTRRAPLRPDETATSEKITGKRMFLTRDKLCFGNTLDWRCGFILTAAPSIYKTPGNLIGGQAGRVCSVDHAHHLGVKHLRTFHEPVIDHLRGNRLPPAGYPVTESDTNAQRALTLIA